MQNVVRFSEVILTFSVLAVTTTVKLWTDSGELLFSVLLKAATDALSCCGFR